LIKGKEIIDNEYSAGVFSGYQKLGGVRMNHVRGFLIEWLLGKKAIHSTVHRRQEKDGLTIDITLKVEMRRGDFYVA
jgi:hypothetical protein